jgi:virginiamycin B lyase
MPIGITTGPDHNLWFTGYGHGRIGRLSLAGEFVFYEARGQTGAGPITTGPDGRLWFPAGDDWIGAMALSGSVQFYPVPTPGSEPWGIAAGPDGNVWYTGLAGVTGRITPAGVVTEFPIPTQESKPWSITTGPDNNLWFTDLGTGFIGQLRL